jgi:hypothetical protein
MKAGHVIKRLSWVSVIIAVVSLPRILAGLFPLHSSGVARDSVIEAAERLGSAPTSQEPAISAAHALGERREEAKSSSDRPVRAPSTERAREDLSELESAQRTLEQLQQAHTEREAADYEGSLRSVTTSGPDLTERE